ncbi:unnamed protein product [Ilex paraguariensis]|uniref:Uncharacterized protein n=1 Tax=Ilex paraguariensis TaxID=185542 RepID=A0ABC8RR63_9AQUA
MSTTTFLLGFSQTARGSASCSPAIQPSKDFRGCWSSGAQALRVNSGLRLRCNALSKPQTQEYIDVLLNGLPLIKWPEIVEDDTEGETLNVVRTVSTSSNKIKERVDSIRSMLASMDDGEISISAYDTAWVALVEDINGSGVPQFPTSLQWIANNQLPDGSWGDSDIFSAHDRIINTLACVIALKWWKIHSDKSEIGD